MAESNNETNDSSKISVQEISFPEGGGAISGLGDSFKANLFSGAGTYSIPVPVTKARGFEPTLSVNYSSGSGSGIFGLGFSLSLSSVSIKTNKGIPKYDGTEIYELDGAALVVQDDTTAIPNPRNDTYEGQDCRVTGYLPRLESAFSQIEHWQNDAGLSFWKVITADNTTAYYGTSSTIANPDDPSQVFSWLIDLSTDNKGNQIVYTYVAENEVNVPHNIYEVNRSNTANRYIATIQYGNYADADGNTNFAFELVFNYGQAAGQAPNTGWTCRPDPFSLYNSGFEIRTYRLCQSIQLVHHFPEELGDAVVVKELGFTYENIQQYTPVVFQGMSMLTKATLTGFRKELSEPQSLPPLEFGYSAFQPPATAEFNMLSVGDGTIPGYLTATQFLPVDLNGEGLPGFLISNDTMSLYFEPLGDGRYAPPAANASFPTNQNIQGGGATLTDLDGNGQLELVVSSPDASGFYERTLENGWNNFIPFDRYPTDLNMETVDLTGNGKSDLLLASTNNLLYYPSQGKKGYSSALDIPSETDFPLIKQGYPQELVCFANMFGDGLSHRVRITNCSVECWPCLGYGQFGKKVTFANAPLLGDDFDASQLFLADIDGSGTTDLAYVYPDRVELFLNQSGNSFSDAVVVYLPELFGSLDKISFTDILGNGTACLVFTKIAPVPRHYYYNFSGESSLPDGSLKQSLKPYLLNKTNNNMGLVSYVNYCSSTKFLLEDKLTGKPWITKLPFPVQLVEETISYESFSESRYVTRYKYHDGYYDPDQKQFMGFGYVESWDSETFEAFQASYSNPNYPVSDLNQELFVPPVYTKTWYLNGAPPPEYEMLLAQYKSEYFNKDTDAYDFPQSRFSPEIYAASEKTFAEAYKALCSKVLRTEIYALDGSAVEANPYSVEESNYNVVLLQAATVDKHAVFIVDPRESISYYYEREYTDPRVEQQFTLKTDDLCGQPTQACTVNLPRRNPQTPLYPEQYTLKGTISTDDYYNSPPSDVTMRLRGINYRDQKYSLLNLEAPASGYFSFDDIDRAVQTALQNITPYMAAPSQDLQAQQFSKVSSYFCDSAGGTLPLGTVSPQALLQYVSTAEFTNDNITTMFGQRLTEDVIQNMGGYVYDAASGYWENHGLVQQYNTAKGFYLPSGTSSALDTMNTVSYDAYWLAPVSITSYISISPPVTNVVTATTDYQAMLPKQQVDINGNVSQAIFDALGQVIVTSLFGTENNQPVGGMLLYDYKGSPAEYQLRTVAPDGGPISFESVIKNEANKEYYLQGASGYFYYDVNACVNDKLPVNSIYLKRGNYAVDPGGETDFSCQTVITYNDGMGRTLAAKTEAEPDGATPRWLTSGRSVYNNKGKVCESYFPYFSNTPFYQTQEEITSLYKVPPPTITHYDPLLRVFRIDTPKGFYSKVEFSPWEQISWDEDDTVTDSVYYKNFMANYPTNPTQEQIDEKNALDMAAGFYGTYTTSVMDNMGGTIRSIQLLKEGTDSRELITWYALDIQGRKLTEIDPRLYAENIKDGTSYYNFKYQYAMSGDQPIVTDSADAGTQKHFSNILDKLIWSLSARDYCQVLYYDGLQRQTQLLVKKVPGTDPISGFDDFNLVELFTYGEEAGAPKGCNLRGQVYILKDLSGIMTTSSYSMLGNALQTNRQMASDYKSPVNWHNTVPLETGSTTIIYTYNALNFLLSETIQDNAVEWNTTSNTYNLEGLLNSISVTTGGVKTDIIKNISYDANQQRTEVVYGNGVTTACSYEDSTLRLTRILSQNGSLPPLNIIQDIAYTYDPVGNITCTRDSSIDTVFNNNQKVDPVSSYQYDSLYRLTKALGRQHPGISGNTYKNNTADGSFMQSIYSQSPINDAQAIENYTETYSYDDSGNLVKKQHTAVSSTWAVDTAVLPNCNRLQNLDYDESGNQKQLTINNVVSLSYNCCENLVSASVIERPDEADDSDYYVYDGSQQRTRKVSELYLNANSSNYKDSQYFGNYETLREGVQSSDGTRTVTTRRQCLRVMDGTTCIAVIYHWIEGGPGSSAGNPAPDQLRYQLGNNLGSVAMELDEQGLLVSYEEYFPYGGTSFIAGPNQVDVSLKTYRYSGKECDNSTGLYYYGRRYYVSWLGRWLNPDPAGTVDGLNLYAFVGGGPISKMDDTGGFGVWAALKGAAVVTGAALLVGASAPVVIGAAVVGATIAGTVYNGQKKAAATTMTDIRKDHAGEFGVAYSTLNWKGVFKGFEVTKPSSWVKTTKKMFEDGHATSIYVSTQGTVSTTGMSDTGYVVSTHKPNGGAPFLRDTESTDTSFYFHSQKITAKKFGDVATSLKGTSASYSELKPNLPGMDRAENCISSSHQFSHALGKENITATKGWWMPSVANHAMRLKSLAPGSQWKHETVHGVSTHIP
jgi:RHS repeat-associated protein